VYPVSNSGGAPASAVVSGGTGDGVIATGTLLPKGSEGFEDDMQNAQALIFAAARQYLPEYLQPFVVGTMNLAHNLDVVTDRFITFFESLHINPPQEFMDVVRRVAKATRPIPSIEVDEVVVVDEVGGIVHHPTSTAPAYEPSAVPVEDPFFRSRREIRAREGPGRRLRAIF